MIKAQKLNKGDKVAIVSLSRGLLGMPFIKHELDLGIKRLKEFGLIPVIMKNSLKSMDYLEEHPEERFEDLKNAFKDSSIKAIIAAIGGNDSHKLIPYMFEDEEFKTLILKNPKIVTGFSDTTSIHLALQKLGLGTFYGPCFLVDIAELDKEMLPYTKDCFLDLFKVQKSIEIKSSEVWYKDREIYDASQLNIPRQSVKEIRGYEVLNGKGIVRGKLYGGCIESIYEALVEDKNSNKYSIFKKYSILPSLQEWKEKILFIETSELKIEPEKLEEILLKLKGEGILSNVRGIIVGKPIDEVYYDEYKSVYKGVLEDLDTPILYNVNFGHSVPRCILPYGCEAIVDFNLKKITIDEEILNN